MRARTVFAAPAHCWRIIVLSLSLPLRCEFRPVRAYYSRIDQHSDRLQIGRRFQANSKLDPKVECKLFLATPGLQFRRMFRERPSPP
jgi:hypothetical protein